MTSKIDEELVRIREELDDKFVDAVMEAQYAAERETGHRHDVLIYDLSLKDSSFVKRLKSEPVFGVLDLTYIAFARMPAKTLFMLASSVES